MKATAVTIDPADPAQAAAAIWSIAEKLLIEASMQLQTQSEVNVLYGVLVDKALHAFGAQGSGDAEVIATALERAARTARAESLQRLDGRRVH